MLKLYLSQAGKISKFLLIIRILFLLANKASLCYYA